jgi:hypothetical protein
MSAVPLPPEKPAPASAPSPCLGIKYSPAVIINAISYDLSTPTTTVSSNINVTVLRPLEINWDLTRTLPRIPIVSTSCERPDELNDDDDDIDLDVPIKMPDVQSTAPQGSINNIGTISDTQVTINNDGAVNVSGLNESKKGVMFPGIPCEFAVRTRRKCVRIFRRRICTPIPELIPTKYIFRTYAKDDFSLKIPTFTFPGLQIKASVSTQVSIDTKLTISSTTPIPYWTNLLVNIIGNQTGATTTKEVFDAFFQAAGSTLMLLLKIIANYVLKNPLIPFPDLSCRIHNTYLNLNINFGAMEFDFGPRTLKIPAFTYKDRIDVFGPLTGLQFGLREGQAIFELVIGTFSLSDSILIFIKAGCLSTAESLKLANPNWQNNSTLKSQIEGLEAAARGLDSLDDFDIPYLSSFPGQPKINLLKRFFELVDPKITISFRLCPVQSLAAVCGRVVFDYTKYLAMLAEFIGDQVSRARFAKKYRQIPTNVTNAIPELRALNSVMNFNDRLIFSAIETAARMAQNALNSTVSVQSFVEFCAPPV